MTIIKTLQDILSCPLVHTALFGTAGGAAALNGATLDEITLLGALGLGADTINYGGTRLASRRWTRELDITKVVGKKYLSGIADLVRSQTGFQGKCQIAEMPLQVQGTSVFSGNGYFKLVYFDFDDGNTAKLFYKYATKNTTSRGAKVTKILHDCGVSIVPDVLLPVGWSFHHNSNDREGTFFQFAEGTTIEEQYNLGTTEKSNQNSSLGSLIDTLFSLLTKQVYTNPEVQRIKESHESSLSDYDFELTAHSFHQTLAKKMTDEQDLLSLAAALDFLYEFDTAYRKSMSDVDRVLVNGDLHQSNVLVKNGNVKAVIDWDNEQYASPYLDFYHFSLISDFERCPEFTQKRQAFLKLFPLQDHQRSIIEFEVALSLLHRYYGVYEQQLFDPRYEQDILTSCRYLLERANQALHQYVNQTGDNNIEQRYTKYVHIKFGQVAAVELDDKASVAYLHRLNHQARTTDYHAQTTHNIQTHVREQGESFTSQHRAAATIESAGNALAIAGLGIVADSLLNEYSELISPQLLVLSLAMIGVTAGSRKTNSMQRMLNYLGNIITRS
ncbi:TPA: phosphotransferase [Candidatus Woesearchaeota archaeon]|nr:phosphotransferase [Candidatus Woesearchaeota archaeon]